MEIRLLSPEDAKIYRECRLRMLREHPEAFGASHEDEKKRPLHEIGERLAKTDDRFVLGAFDRERLVGTVGFFRNRGAKTRHKGLVWGMYTTPEVRGRGIGKALLESLLNRVRSRPGLEQVHITVAADNRPAIGLYQSMGFEVYGREEKALKLPDRYVDEDWMVLWLNR
ncbi:RimJ/RimL family protein N-acetyltransferase [Melghirimyces profundicolus]|uniref:RimJ/RimL family protein N-acetyltransferase n=1 Tax=Melghirimyces profundicolus TaxID=1242148 RepID=A0A2T6C4U5_9BACL|nr:GNAT family N-acetyltransferase [Melghirimyces profundicolus]PTX63307.1 RimJ/RimL family protein N-acetyltransferase [Melghirimyces profundicolus]